jgi:UDP-glucose 4-epimerase
MGDWRRALVTGGAGFIGSHLVDHLLATGVEVTVLDDLTEGRRTNLARPGAAALRVVEGSVLDERLVDELVRGQDVVFHLAAVVGVRNVLADPLRMIDVNVAGTRSVLEAAHRHSVRALLASSSEVYGINSEVPFREDSARVLGPTWVSRWSYATAKALDEHVAFALAERGLAMSIVRYFNIYGPRVNVAGYASVVGRFCEQAISGAAITVHGTGSQTRSFTYVADAVAGTLAAASRPQATGAVFNIGGGPETTIGELASLVRELAGSKSDIVRVPYETDYPRGFADAPRRVADVGKARDVLDYRARTALREGLGLTLEWYRARVAAAGAR